MARATRRAFPAFPALRAWTALPRPLALSLLACAAAAAHAAGDAASEQAWGLSGQATLVGQSKPGFAAAYSGSNSLGTRNASSHSITSTLFAGLRPWAGGEFYLNPEAVAGVPLSGLTGLGGLTNGELQKTAGRQPVVYLARAFLRQSWALDDEREAVDADANQLAGQRAPRRVVLTLGKLGVTDLFDDNAWAHDARTDFLNWGFLTHGHYDYAADSRGYSQGLALEWIERDWAVRAARFAVPRASNGLPLDKRLGSRHGDQLEIERQHRIGDRKGTLRLLVFSNRATMAAFDDALAAAPNGAAPTLDGVRRLQTKRGWGLALEQDLTATLSGFARIGRHDGRTEVYSFTSIDNAVSAGLVWKGAAWQRAGDRLGVAVASHGISRAHQRFLAAGGIDFFIGDGALRPGREGIVEAVYTALVAPRLWMALDVQRIQNPAYNRDRGPVQVFSLRLHAEM